MNIQGLFAVVSTADMDASEAFYTALIGRAPDDRPMDGLIEWRNLAGAGLQVAHDAGKAGSSEVTLVTPDMAAARRALADAGLTLGEDIQGDFGIIAQIDDPDGNRLTLAEPPKAMQA
ncbi:VOC family protein [Brucella sp. JSBI001]|uniref:VOC family protein n=1 Tax=Brucella sp. JSBI001 TaxID=2886044 RepID=UPI00222FE3E2|nr:VOC family protein [Brucella sp. JSBI001]UZD69378.1 VOC family protein [Brucella sp. JSBI001]